MHQLGRLVKIEAELGFPIEWLALPEKRASRLLVKRLNSPLDKEESWPDYRLWMTQKLEAFDRVFRPRVKLLDPDRYADEAEG